MTSAGPRPEPTAPGKESVWDYPRPPRLEPVSKTIEVVFNGQTVARTSRAYRVLETSHPPVYYLPPEDVLRDALRPAAGSSWCEWKGQAAYFDVSVGGRTAPKAVWTYPQPSPAFAPIAGYLAFYAAPMDACYVDGERVRPQPGGFYGGWITDDLAGPFKGEPGTASW